MIILKDIDGFEFETEETIFEGYQDGFQVPEKYYPEYRFNDQAYFKMNCRPSDFEEGEVLLDIKWFPRAINFWDLIGNNQQLIIWLIKYLKLKKMYYFIQLNSTIQQLIINIINGTSNHPLALKIYPKMSRKLGSKVWKKMTKKHPKDVSKYFKPNHYWLIDLIVNGNLEHVEYFLDQKSFSKNNIINAVVLAGKNNIVNYEVAKFCLDKINYESSRLEGDINCFRYMLDKKVDFYNIAMSREICSRGLISHLELIVERKLPLANDLLETALSNFRYTMIYHLVIFYRIKITSQLRDKIIKNPMHYYQLKRLLNY